MNRIDPPTAAVHELRDCLSGLLRIPVNIRLPHPDNRPPFPLQQSVVAAITITVRPDLRNPIGRVGARAQLLGEPLPVSSVPEVSIAEDDYTRSRKNNVGLSR
jgi:hypothetical protein